MRARTCRPRRPPPCSPGTAKVHARGVAAAEAAHAQLDGAAADDGQYHPGAERRGRDTTGDRVGDPAPTHRGAAPTRRDRDCTPAFTATAATAAPAPAAAPSTHPGGDDARNSGGEPQDDHEPGSDEGNPAGDRTGRSRDRPRTEDRELRRGRARQRVACRDRVLELGRRDPSPALHAQPPQQRDMRGRSPEAGDADPAPLDQHLAEANRRVGHQERRPPSSRPASPIGRNGPISGNVPPVGRSRSAGAARRPGAARLLAFAPAMGSLIKKRRKRMRKKKHKKLLKKTRWAAPPAGQVAPTPLRPGGRRFRGLGVT